MAYRIYNFSAGPAVLPEDVLIEARDNLLSLGESGIGILEISHRSKEFEGIMKEAEVNLRTLLGLAKEQRVLFLSGGATTQFSMVPMNLLGKAPAKTADYVVTGEWSKKALAEARRIGPMHVAASTEGENFVRVPKNSELDLSPDGVYLHFTSNNTIWGTQFHHTPDPGGKTLVCDMSSDFLSRPLADIQSYGLVYAGAQKNAGPAGVTVVLLRPELVDKEDRPDLPIMMNYRTHLDNKSLYNTPPVFSIYVVHLVLKWLLKQGGLSAVEAHNQRKAQIIYDAIDAAPDFYRGHAHKDSRSLMNITFRLPNKDLEERFVEKAKKEGMDGLKGYRTVGGIRASVYNAFPLSGAEALAAFMKEFARTSG